MAIQTDSSKRVLIDDVSALAAELTLDLTSAFVVTNAQVAPKGRRVRTGARQKRGTASTGEKVGEFFTDRTIIERIVGTVLRNRLNRQVVVVDESLDLLAQIGRILPDVRSRHSEQTIEKLVDALVETHDPLARTTKQIDGMNATARMRFVDKIETLSSDELATAAGHSARNRSQTATRWKSEKKIFSIRWQGQERYPGFQFKDGKPLAVIQQILGALPDGLSPWETAFWFVSTNSWLDGRAPYEMLESAQRVVKAAHEQSEAVHG